MKKIRFAEIAKLQPFTTKNERFNRKWLNLSTLEVTPRFELGNEGFADPCLTTWLCHRMEKGANALLLFFCGAGDEESAAAPPVADKARRFRGSGTIGAHPKGGGDRIAATVSAETPVK